MNSKVKTVLYGLGAFCVFLALVVILRLISGDIPEQATIFGIFSKNDFLLGLVVAVVVTFTRERRKKMKE